ncbi:hypothetical protein Srot_2935 [Segniliparus rotundus DSM 44985]|uniref:Uncharacterized protein n=1 Tax=Segniliparus rotundus (strain ATCC BAA-972 / CDC 1076 / CIP 108378 / DSM 44985 / JCM 13578) TaxID=640132 RepID=D6ZDV7_SEGRD|nr:hypothetical protein [Segniliparus rotundus]ADG99364.1 hypothetical protein Srot_2935 [Segniliparus rotundus DSM 44985]
MTEHEGFGPDWLTVEPETARLELAKAGELARQTREAVAERVARVPDPPAGAVDLVSAAAARWQEGVFAPFLAELDRATGKLAEFSDEAVSDLGRVEETERDNAEDVRRATRHLEDRA